MSKKKPASRQRKKSTRPDGTVRITVDLMPEHVQYLDRQSSAMGFTRVQLLRMILTGCEAHANAMESPGVQRMLTDLVSTAIDAGVKNASKQHGGSR